MDELELLKKDWKKSESSYPKLSYNEIYKLIHKKSSSIVKYIFIICIAEFLFWAALNLVIPESYFEIYEKFHLKSFLDVSLVINYLIIIVFIYLFYKNYKAISVTDSANLLMQKILRTRKTVKYYVIYNIIIYIILSVILNVIFILNPELLMDFYKENYNLELNVNPETFVKMFIVIQIILLIITCLLILLFYRIVYGILLKKLHKNYSELKYLDN